VAWPLEGVYNIAASLICSAVRLSKFSSVVANLLKLSTVNGPQTHPLFCCLILKSTIFAVGANVCKTCTKLLMQAAGDAIISGKEHIDLEILEQISYRSPTGRRKLYETMVC
jgi:hypothetical protein